MEPNASANFDQPMESVSLGVHALLWQRHRVAFIVMWIVCVGGALAISISLYLSGHLQLSFVQDDQSFLLPLFILVGPPMLVYGIAWGKMQHEFIRQMGESLGYTYERKMDLADISGNLFSVGHSRSAYDFLSGVYKDFPIRIFSYRYTVGSGKYSHTYMETVFALTYSSALPHILLNSAFYYSIIGSGAPSGMELVELEGDFNKYFSLYVAHGEQMEVREIFQPDLMQEWKDEFDSFRFEIMGRDIYIMCSGSLSDKGTFLKTRDLADSLLDKLIPNLRAPAQDVAAAL